MTRCPLLPPLAVLALLASGACGSDDVQPVDAGSPDMGTVDVPDGGVRAKCPLPGNDPSCVAVADMAQGCLQPTEMLREECAPFCPGRPPTRSCSTGFCPVVCAVGQCIEPETILQNEPLNLNMDVGAVQSATYFVRVVMYGETSGGNPFTCADVMAAPLTFFDDPCYNVTDVRASPVQPGPGNVYTFTFSRVPASTPMVFVVYGFASDDTAAAPLGISCTEIEVPASGSGMGAPIEVNATTMTFL